MVRQLLTGAAAKNTGTEATYAAAHVDGHLFFPNVGDEVRIKNGNAATCNVTIDIPRTQLGVAATDLVIPVATTKEFRIKFDQELIGMATRPEGGTDPGAVWINCSVQASVTLQLERR